MKTDSGDVAITILDRTEDLGDKEPQESTSCLEGTERGFTAVAREAEMERRPICPEIGCLGCCSSLKPGIRGSHAPLGTMAETPEAPEEEGHNVRGVAAVGWMYYVNSRDGAEQELQDEVQSREGVGQEYSSEVASEDIERLEGEGPTASKPNDIENMVGGERSMWIAALPAELDSFKKLEVFDEVSNVDTHDRYWSKGIRTQNRPSKCVAAKQPTHDNKGGWKPKYRGVVCDNFET